MPATTALERLAKTLRRPLHAVADLACLAPPDLAELEASIESACQRQRAEVRAALRHALPQPLRSLMLGKLGAKEKEK